MTRICSLGTLLLAISVATGCANEQRVEVDLSASMPRFILKGRTWGWPFVWPHINALAIASDRASVWELETSDKRGVPAKDLAIVYGEVPAGFVQTHPANDMKPGRLIPGKNYYLGATGSGDEVFRTVFALPMYPLGRPSDPTGSPDRKRMNPSVAPGVSPKPAE